MNIPKPGPSKSLKRPTSKSKKKLRWLVEYPNGTREEVFAVDEIEALSVSNSRTQMIPSRVRLAPFVPSEHLEQRPLRNHEGLADLRKQLTKENNRG